MLTLPEFALQAAERLLPLARRVPQPLQRLALQQGLNRLLAGPLADGQFAVLEGRWLRLEVDDLGLAWTLGCRDGQLLIDAQATAEASIRGQWRDLLLLASRQEDPDTLFFRRRLVIEGDTELGLAVKNLMDALDPDSLPPWFWERLQRTGEWLAEHGAPV